MKDKLITYMFVGILFFFFALSIVLPDTSVSFSERRTLAEFPNWNGKEIWSGEFFEDMNKYLTDQFPFREEYRMLKGMTLNYVFQKHENNEVFQVEDRLYQLNTSLNRNSLNHFLQTIQKIDETYLSQNNIYYAIIPDKNYYLEEKGIPRFPYETLLEELRKEWSEYREIDLTDVLSKDSYYKTDIHWRQEKLEPVLRRIEETMQLERSTFPIKQKEYSPFYGALYGRIATVQKPDTLTYCTNETIENTIVYHYEKQQNVPVYLEENLEHIDSYDVFLSGATPLLILENQKQENGRELILFRDSFGSSLAPLLIENYSKITMIDLRYLSSALLGSIPEIDFSNPDTDILFLYSVPIINNSFTLK